ncbi:hypothetical protein CYMTET_5408 [Cymbomonas tetramitiformis]|uniref:Uncharacterized protein n=1 Tax=Cymbomonas tetramitiformis TaxID=36881 RepID=A0AAE0GZ75_9CHLO|nr:hypothetical protein CYMTET_5408 [Cymbomonas tetramitiformis]
MLLIRRGNLQRQQVQEANIEKLHLLQGRHATTKPRNLFDHEFEDVLDPVDIHSFIALASFYSKYYGKCSKAFIKLESSSAIPSEKQERFAELAISIFTKHPPQDPSSKGGRKGKEAKVGLHGKIAQTVCVASGKEVSGESMMGCKHCKHVMINSELRGDNFCPLCHGSISESLGGMGVDGGPGSLYPLPIYEDTGLE